MPRREETVYYATDPEGDQWTVSLHDDGTTWNLVRCSSWGAFVGGAAGFTSAEAAMAHADRQVDAMVDSAPRPVR
jgi:hypothetical protein